MTRSVGPARTARSARCRPCRSSCTGATVGEHARGKPRHAPPQLTGGNELLVPSLGSTADRDDAGCDQHMARSRARIAATTATGGPAQTDHPYCAPGWHSTRSGRPGARAVGLRQATHVSGTAALPADPLTSEWCTVGLGNRSQRFCITLSALLLIAGVVGIWSSRTALDTPRWVATVTPLANDADVDAALAQYLTDQLQQIRLLMRFSGWPGSRSSRTRYTRRRPRCPCGTGNDPPVVWRSGRVGPKVHRRNGFKGQDRVVPLVMRRSGPSAVTPLAGHPGRPCWAPPPPRYPHDTTARTCPLRGAEGPRTPAPSVPAGRRSSNRAGVNK